MSKKIAFYLRKLADLFDPKISPSQGSLSIRIEADTEQCMEALQKIREEIEKLDPQLEKLARLGAVLSIEAN